MIKWTKALKEQVNKLVPIMVQEDCFQSGDWWHSFMLDGQWYDLNIWLEYPEYTTYLATLYKVNAEIDEDFGLPCLVTDYNDFTNKHLKLPLVFR